MALLDVRLELPDLPLKVVEAVLVGFLILDTAARNSTRTTSPS
jgi:hypothetical protein